MSGAAIEIEALARRLHDARSERRTIAQLVHEHPNLSMPVAYEIQRAGLELRRADGDGAPIGYKVGLGSLARQQSMGVDEPIRGGITAGMLQSEDVPLALSELVHPRLEAEIGFLIGERIEAKRASVPEVLRATAGVMPAFEIVDSRYDDARFTAVDAVADNGSAARVLLGGPLVDPRSLDLSVEGVVVRADGEVVATAAGAAVGGQPAAAVAWLARSLGGLEPGTVVISGGINAAVPLSNVRSIVASFTHLGSISLAVR